MKSFIFTNILTFFVLTTTFSQSINKEIVKKDNAPFLLGKINKKGLSTANYSWFNKNYDDYKVDEAIVKKIASHIKNFQITLFMGTWCGDSKRDVPRFYKILEACNFPKEQLTAIAVSREPQMYKQSPEHEEIGLNIHRVPTFIFYKNGKEINRIIEDPIKSLEKDILNIVTINTYKSQYQIVTQLNNIIKSEGIKGIKNHSKAIIKSYKNELESMYELNTYAYILFTSNRQNEAIEISKLNIKLFPKNANTYLSLANKYKKVKNKKKAKKYYKKALKFEPENKKIKQSLNSLETKSKK